MSVWCAPVSPVDATIKQEISGNLNSVFVNRDSDDTFTGMIVSTAGVGTKTFIRNGYQQPWTLLDEIKGKPIAVAVANNGDDIKAIADELKTTVYQEKMGLATVKICNGKKQTKVSLSLSDSLELAVSAHCESTGFKGQIYHFVNDSLVPVGNSFKYAENIQLNGDGTIIALTDSGEDGDFLKVYTDINRKWFKPSTLFMKFGQINSFFLSKSGKQVAVNFT